MTAAQRAEAKLALLRELETITALLRDNEQEHTVLLDQRAEKARSLRQAGASIEELGEVLGVGRSRVHQILRGTRT